MGLAELAALAVGEPQLVPGDGQAGRERRGLLELGDGLGKTAGLACQQAEVGVRTGEVGVGLRQRAKAALGVGGVARAHQRQRVVVGALRGGRDRAGGGGLRCRDGAGLGRGARGLIGGGRARGCSLARQRVAQAHADGAASAQQCRRGQRAQRRLHPVQRETFSGSHRRSPRCVRSCCSAPAAASSALRNSSAPIRRRGLRCCGAR